MKVWRPWAILRHKAGWPASRINGRIPDGNTPIQLMFSTAGKNIAQSGALWSSGV
jgi:hypothetical protein